MWNPRKTKYQFLPHAACHILEEGRGYLQWLVNSNYGNLAAPSCGVNILINFIAAKLRRQGPWRLDVARSYLISEMVWVKFGQYSSSQSRNAFGKPFLSHATIISNNYQHLNE